MFYLCLCCGYEFNDCMKNIGEYIKCPHCGQWHYVESDCTEKGEIQVWLVEATEEESLGGWV